MQGERKVAGLRCSEVLADLSDYLDDELPRERRQKVEAHLAGCEVCERFGGEVGAVVAAVKQRLGSEALSADVAGRLADRLAEALDDAG